jgi:hypothetical protein
MKKISIIILALLFISCSNDNDNDCKCPKAKMKRFEVNSSYFYINNLPIDCKTQKPNEEWLLQNNYVYIKCE